MTKDNKKGVKKEEKPVTTVPGETAPTSPLQDATASPIQVTIVAPTEDATAVPTEPVTASPIKGTTAVPAEDTTSPRIENDYVSSYVGRSSIPTSGTSTTSDYFPSGSAWPWTDLKEKNWSSEEYISFLKDAKTNQEVLKFKTTELDAIEAFKTKQECHRYRLKRNQKLAFYDSILIIFDNILKILPVVIFSSLPLLLLGNVLPLKLVNATQYNNSTNASANDILSQNTDLIYWVYGIMVSAIIIALVLRYIFKNEFMINEQYVIAVNKKEEEIVEKNKKAVNNPDNENVNDR